MVFVLRFICITLLMIVGNLFLPDLKLGGRYMILLEAFTTTVVAYLLRYALSNLKITRHRSIFTGASILIGLFLIRSLFPGVNLSLMGILFLYFGVVLLEMILPNPNSYERPSNGLS